MTEELVKLKSEIELMKKVIIKLANITVQAGFNCNYSEQNELYSLIFKMEEQNLNLKGCSNCKYVTSNIENQSHCSKCGGNHSEWKLKN